MMVMTQLMMRNEPRIKKNIIRNYKIFIIITLKIIIVISKKNSFAEK